MNTMKDEKMKAEVTFKCAIPDTLSTEDQKIEFSLWEIVIFTTGTFLRVFGVRQNKNKK